MIIRLRLFVIISALSVLKYLEHKSYMLHRGERGGEKEEKKEQLTAFAYRLSYEQGHSHPVLC